MAAGQPLQSGSQQDTKAHSGKLRQHKKGTVGSGDGGVRGDRGWCGCL